MVAKLFDQEGWQDHTSGLPVLGRPGVKVAVDVLRGLEDLHPALQEVQALYPESGSLSDPYSCKCEEVDQRPVPRRDLLRQRPDLLCG